MRALVTGGGRGIGAATAISLAAEGFDLVLVSRTLKELENTRERIRKEYPDRRIDLFSLDISREDQILSLFDQTGSFDVVVNNAGYIKVAPIEHITSLEWRNTLDINLSGPFFICREVFRRQTPHKACCIINISSLGGILGLEKFPGFSAYSSAKAGLVILTECLAVEGQSRNIRVNAVAPGAVDTQMLREALPEVKTSTRPEDIAREILYFVTDPVGKTLSGVVKELTNA